MLRICGVLLVYSAYPSTPLHKARHVSKAQEHPELPAILTEEQAISGGIAPANGGQDVKVGPQLAAPPKLDLHQVRVNRVAAHHRQRAAHDQANGAGDPESRREQVAGIGVVGDERGEARYHVGVTPNDQDAVTEGTETHRGREGVFDKFEERLHRRK